MNASGPMRRQARRAIRVVVGVAAVTVVLPTAASASYPCCTPQPVPAGTFTSVSFDIYKACAIRTNETLACWGDPPRLRRDQYGEPPSGRFRAVSVGDLHACGVREDFSLACWGEDTFHNGATTPPAGAFTAVATARGGACALRVDATLACWGRLLVARSDPRPTGTFMSVRAGDDAICAIRTDATLTCWGYGKVGLDPPPRGAFRSVSVSHTWALPAGDFACAVRTDTTVTCWGNEPRLAGEEGPTGVVVATPPGPGFATVSTFNSWACAIKTDATLACWGQGVSSDITTPPSGTFKSLTVGWGASCAVRTNGALVCWPLPSIPASKALSLPSPKRCVSQRRFTIHIRKLAGITWDSAVIKLRGKRVKTIKRPRLGAFINLTGLPKGTFKVSITATTTDGRTVTGTRTYHTCAPRHSSSGTPKL